MFEILRAFETAKNEKNKFLRSFLIRYTRHKLKSSFFERFNVEDIPLTRELLSEFVQFCECTGIASSDSEPFPYYTDIEKVTIHLSYNIYLLSIKVKSNEYEIEVTATLKNASVTMSMDEEKLNLNFLKEIFLMAIYNYCVAYIYGKKSSLYKWEPKYIKPLDELFL